MRKRLADWLGDQRAYRAICIQAGPIIPIMSSPGRVLPAGFGHMLCFELEDRDAVNRFMHAAKGIPFSPSLGQHADDAQPPRDHIAPLRQPSGEATPRHQRRPDPVVRRRGAAGADSKGAGEGIGVTIFV